MAIDCLCQCTLVGPFTIDHLCQSILVGSFTIAISSIPTGLVIDWMSSNMYWTDRTARAVWVSRLGGQYMKKIISGVNNIGAIALDRQTRCSTCDDVIMQSYLLFNNLLHRYNLLFKNILHI